MGAESDSLTEWAAALRSAKHRLGLTVQDISKRAGVAHGTVVKVVQGNSGILLRHIVAVAEALNLVADVVVTPAEPKPVAEMPSEQVVEKPLTLSGSAHGVRFTITIEPDV